MKLLVDDLYNDAATKSESASPRVVFAIVVVAVAYHASLSPLIANARFDTRSGRFAIVFPLAVALALAYRHSTTEVSIHDRQVDWIVGLPLVVFSAALNASSFAETSSDYLAHRVDLLSLPIFVAGVTVLLFGLRALGRQWRSIACLFFAWPVPFDAANNHLFGGPASANAATTFLIAGLAAWPLATGRSRDKAMWLAGSIGLVGLTGAAAAPLGPVVQFLIFLAGTAAMLALLPRFGITHRFADAREQPPPVGPFRPPVRAASVCVLAAAVAIAMVSHGFAP